MYHKHKETADDVPFEQRTEMIHEPERSSMYWNGSCNSSRGEAQLVNVLNGNILGVRFSTHRGDVFIVNKP